jgi:hypothetical protein
MHVIYCVNLPWSAAARLRKVFLQLPYLSAFSLIKRVLRDALIVFYHIISVLSTAKEIFDITDKK